MRAGDAGPSPLQPLSLKESLLAMGPNSQHSEIWRRLGSQPHASGIMDNLRPAPLTIGSLAQFETPFLLSNPNPHQYFSPLPVASFSTPGHGKPWYLLPGTPLPVPLTRTPPAFDPKQDYTKLFLLQYHQNKQLLESFSNVLNQRNVMLNEYLKSEIGTSSICGSEDLLPPQIKQIFVQTSPSTESVQKVIHD